MLYELPYRRILLLTEGHFGVFSSKTAMSMLRYRGSDIVGILDSAYSGGRTFSFESGDPQVWPVVNDVAEAMQYEPDALLIGIAPVGGALPGIMSQHLIDALNQGLGIVSGLHTALGDDPELAELAERHDARIYDLRDPGPIQRIAGGAARTMGVKRVLTVGTSCNVGKMVTALELRRSAVEAGLDAAFVATGQTGIMIEGWGIAIDHVLSDFTAGAAEMLVEHVANRQICFIEGQGSIEHPGYSGVMLSLLHGTCPDALVLCHHAGRLLHNDRPECPIASLNDQIAIYERVLAPLHAGKVVAVAVNTVDMPDGQAEAAIKTVAGETGLPAADPIRSGCAELLTAVRGHLGM